MQKSVLIVEDEPLIAVDFAMLLEMHGWRVIGPVATVIAALHLLSNETPSAGLLDVDLGGETITPVAEYLAARGTPFVLSSAYADPARIGGTVLAGALNVGKPAQDKALVKALEQLTRS